VVERRKHITVWVDDSVHGRTKISEIQLETLEVLSTSEWTPVYEPEISGKSREKAEGERLPIVSLRVLARNGWIRMERRGERLFVRKTELGGSIRRSEKPERWGMSCL